MVSEINILDPEKVIGRVYGCPLIFQSTRTQEINYTIKYMVSEIIY
jgi:hypothetical protein